MDKMRISRSLYKPMKRQLDGARMRVWTEQVGGQTEATWKIVRALNCSSSKAEKIARGEYPSLPSESDQVTLADLTKIKREELFPAVSAAG